jgi:1,3-beta-glucanosyltransferase GAS5
MTGVFSGGLAYEYSLETNMFGLVDIKPSGSITELEGFSLLAKALKNTPDPPNNGGYNEQGATSDCPKPTKLWLPQNNSLPRIPGDAESFFKNGAGAGKGKEGAPKCSHWCGKTSKGFESQDGSGTGKDGKPKPDKNQGNTLQAAGMRLITVGFVAMALL